MLSGPSFAIELANGAETGFVVASLTEECASIVKNTLEETLKKENERHKKSKKYFRK